MAFCYETASTESKIRQRDKGRIAASDSLAVVFKRHNFDPTTGECKRCGAARTKKETTRR